MQNNNNIPNFYAGGLWVAYGMANEYYNLKTKFNYLIEYRRNEIEQFINSLLLYDEITIPTQDFIVVFSLLKVLGQANLIKLFETKKIKFVRLNGMLTYLPGHDLIWMQSADSKQNTNSLPPEETLKFTSTDLTINMGLIPIDNRLIKLVSENTIEVQANQIETLKETNLDVDNNPYLREKFGIINIKEIEGFYSPPGQFRVFTHSELNPNKKNDAADKILEIAYANMEFYMSNLTNCTFSSTFVPVGHFLKEKQKRVFNREIADDDFLKLLNLGNYPNIGKAILNKEIDLKEVLMLKNSQDAEDFKKWFHETIKNNPHDIVKEAFALHRSLIKDVKQPRFGKLRFAVTNLLGIIPLVGGAIGALASSIDSFVISNMLKRKSPLYFLDDLYRIIPQNKN